MYKHECWIKKLAGQKWCRAFAQPHNWGSEKKKNILRVALNYEHKTCIQVPIKQNYSSEEKKMRRTRDRFGRQQMGGVFFIKSPEWTISARKPVAIPLVFSFLIKKTNWFFPSLWWWLPFLGSPKRIKARKNKPTVDDHKIEECQGW